MTAKQAQQQLIQDKSKLIPMSETYPYKLCRLSKPKDNSLEKPWYVEFYVWDATKQKLHRKRYVLSDDTAKAREIEAAKLIKQTNQQLIAGAVINPVQKKQIGPIQPETPLLEAIAFFLKYIKGSKKPRTYETYKSDLQKLTDYLTTTNQTNLTLGTFTFNHAQAYIDYLIIDQQLKNLRINNLKATNSAFFGFYQKRKTINENPFKGIDNLDVQASKHKSYTNQEALAIKNYCLEHDPRLWLAISFVYYGFIRAGYELRSLTIGNLFEKTILIEGQNSKSGDSEHVMIPAALEKIIQQYKLRDYPKHYYILGTDGPSETMVDKNHWYRRHVKALEATKLTGLNHDFYAWKHTGVIALWFATKEIELIRSQCRHKDIATTLLYLRDLGIYFDYTLINKFPEL
ncbi:tyrosine-type recombinase/integrase [Lacihabitans soyangensis]|nr:site-specific integrase [Lacihabitans soyangensis]